MNTLQNEIGTTFSFFFYLGMIDNTVLVSGVQHSDLIAFFFYRLYFFMYCYKILGVIPHAIE